MPPDRGPCAVLGDEHVAKHVLCEPGEPCRELAKRKKKRRNVLGFVKRPIAEVVAPTEGNHAALAGEPVKFEVSKRKTPNFLNELGLGFRRQHLALVLEPLGHPGGRREEIELAWHGRHRVQVSYGRVALARRVVVLNRISATPSRSPSRRTCRLAAPR
jgi:hypothetical protein